MDEIGHLNIGEGDNPVENVVEAAAVSYPNPLINPCVLEILFPYVGVNDLRNCRLVSRFWNKEATPYLKKKAMIYFDGHYDEDDPPAEADRENGEYRNIQNYLKKMSHFQFESYCLSKGAKHTECSRELSEFFERYGSDVKHLRIDYEYHSHFKVSLLRHILINYLPNLEHLDIRNIPVVEGRMTKHQELINVSNDLIGHCAPDDLPVFWSRDPYKQFPSIKRIDLWNYNAYVAKLGRNFVKDLFEVSPNLECFQVVDRYYSNIITYVLEGIRDNHSWGLNLKELIFDSCESPSAEDIKVLSELNLTLKVLRLGTLPIITDPAAFQGLLNKQCGTLEELQFGNCLGNTTIRVALPIFPKLMRLELTQDVPKAGQFNVIFDPVNYEQQFPVLQVLSNCRSRVFYPHDDMAYEICQRSKHEGKHFFRGMTDLWKRLFPRDGQICSSLRILDIPYPKEPQSPFVHRLAIMFPSVNNESLNRARNDS